MIDKIKKVEDESVVGVSRPTVHFHLALGGGLWFTLPRLDAFFLHGRWTVNVV